jgi:hypothetical protein
MHEGQEAVDLFLYFFDKILTVRLEGLFWVGNKMGCSFFLWTLALAFGGFTLCLAKGSNSYYFIGYFQLISLDSQQSLAIQFHGLTTWTAIV